MQVVDLEAYKLIPILQPALLQDHLEVKVEVQIDLIQHIQPSHKVHYQVYQIPEVAVVEELVQPVKQLEVDLLVHQE